MKHGFMFCYCAIYFIAFSGIPRHTFSYSVDPDETVSSGSIWFAHYDSQPNLQKWFMSETKNEKLCFRSSGFYDTTKGGYVCICHMTDGN